MSFSKNKQKTCIIIKKTLAKWKKQVYNKPQFDTLTGRSVKASKKQRILYLFLME